MSANPRTKPAPARRALVAVAVPTTMAVLLCTAALAGTAFASGSPSTTPTPCGTGGPTGKPVTATPATGAQTRPAPTASATVKPTTAPAIAPTPAATQPAKAPSGTPTTAPATPPMPTSTPTDGGNGFWGWLNGVWQWIFSDDVQRPGGQTQQLAAQAGPLQAVPLTQAGSAHTTPPRSGTVKADPAMPDPVETSPAKSKKATAVLCPTTAAPLHRDDAAPAQVSAALIPWHLQTPSMTMYGLAFNGVDTVKTANGPMQVMDFTAARVDIVSMVTYSYPGGASGPRQYNNAGSGTTTVLTNVHLWTATMTASVYGLIQVTLTPTAPITTILGVAQGFTIPIPVVFTDVDADNALLSSGSLDVPGFLGYSGG